MIAPRSEFVQPVEIWNGRVAKVSSGFGTRTGVMHNAVDIMFPRLPGDPVGHPDSEGDYTMPVGVHALSITHGVVERVSYDPSRGWYVEIRHPATKWGYTSLRSGYQHLTRPFVKVGDKVKVGQRIAVIGKNGGVRHLHFLLFVNGKLIDPKPWIESWPALRPGGRITIGTAVFLATSFAVLAGAVGYVVYVRTR